MISKYWGLQEKPFGMICPEKMMYLSHQYKEALARLFYLVDQRRVAGMITGPFGVGKTLTFEFLRKRALRKGIPVIQVDAIPNGSLPMARHILRNLHLPDEASTLAEALMTMQAVARTPGAGLKHTLLLIDEAQQLSYGDGFYFVHYLCNLRIPEGDVNEGPLFTIILGGTESLRESMKAQESLRRRIQLDWSLKPLSQTETREYIHQHTEAAGVDKDIFDEDAMTVIYQHSGGVPRSINNICDTALMLGFAANAPVVDKRIAAQAARDTGFKHAVAKV